MRAVKIGLAAVLAMISAEGGARNIRLIAAEIEAPKKSILLMDTDTLRVSASGELRAWSYLYLAVPGKDKMSIIELDAFDCKDMRVKTVSQTFYSIDGAKHFDNADVGTWDFAVPGSIGYQLLEAGCGKAPDKNLILGDVEPTDMFKEFAETGKVISRPKQ